MAKYGVSMKGIGVALPETVVSNEDISQLVDTNDEWIVSRTGFRERRVVSGDQVVTDLAIEASKNALAYAGIEGKDVDLIINACSTPEYIYPAGCCVVQHAIGATNAFGFDLSMGCSGLMYALATATQFIENGTAKTALVLTSDVHSRYTDWHDRNTCVLFGDGAGALVITRHETPGETDVLGLDMYLDGSKGEQLKLPVPRDNCPLAEPRTKEKEKSAVWMNGREVFKFAVGEVPKLLNRTLDRSGLTMKDIDYLVLHQANIRIMDAMVERLDLRPEQMVVSLEKYSNTSATSITLALYDALESGQVKPGSTLLLCGFGAGLAVASAVVKWQCVDQRKKKVEEAVALVQ